VQGSASKLEHQKKIQASLKEIKDEENQSKSQNENLRKENSVKNTESDANNMDYTPDYSKNENMNASKTPNKGTPKNKKEDTEVAQSPIVETPRKDTDVVETTRHDGLVDTQTSAKYNCLKEVLGLQTRFGTQHGPENFMDMEKRFCANCNIDQPIRCKHCKHCKFCVATFDHHCIWIGNCIGEKNKWLFFIFLIAQITTLVMSLISIMDDFMEANSTKSKWISDHVMSVF